MLTNRSFSKSFRYGRVVPTVVPEGPFTLTGDLSIYPVTLGMDDSVTFATAAVPTYPVSLSSDGSGTFASAAVSTYPVTLSVPNTSDFIAPNAILFPGIFVDNSPFYGSANIPVFPGVFIDNSPFFGVGNIAFPGTFIDQPTVFRAPSAITFPGTITLPPPTYALSSSSANVVEGNSVTINLSTTGLADSTSVPWTITGANITAADLNLPSLSGAFTLSANVANIVINVASDIIVETAETFTLALNSITPTVSTSVTIIDGAFPPPVANFIANVTTGVAPLTVSFTDTSTNSPTAWAWDFTNDGTTDSTTQNPTHTFSSSGTYSVKLTATNSGGSNTVIKTNYITIGSIPDANFVANVTSGSAPLTVSFTDTSTNTPTVWAWDFTNDGNTDSTLQNASHTYNSAGTYSVKLTASNAAGSNVELKSNYITVGCEPYQVSVYPWTTHFPNDALDPNWQSLYDDPTLDGVTLNLNLGGYYDSWVGSGIPNDYANGVYTNLINNPYGPGVYFLDGGYWSYDGSYWMMDVIDLWRGGQTFTISDPTVVSRYSAIGGSADGSINANPGWNQYSGVSTFTAQESFFQARNYGYPVIAELWYSLNQSRSNPLVGYNNYSFIGDDKSGTEAQVDNPGAYIKTFYTGFFKATANMYSPLDSDFIAGTSYIGNASGGTLKLYLNGVVVQTATVTEPVYRISDNWGTSYNDPDAFLLTGKSWIGYLELTAYTASGSTFIYQDNPWPDGTPNVGLIDTYQIKQALMVDTYTGLPSGVQDTNPNSHIWWYPNMFYALPNTPLLCAPTGNLPNYTPAAPIPSATSLLMHFNSSPFIDSSLYNRTITPVKGAAAPDYPVLDTVQYQFGPGSGSFSALNGFQINDTTGIDLDGDFTIEMWDNHYAPVGPVWVSRLEVPLVINNIGIPGDYWELRYDTGSTPNTGHYSLVKWPNGVINGTVTGQTNFAANEWRHVAWTRQGGVHRLFVNGVSQGSYSDTSGINPTVLTIGCRNNLSTGVVGNLDELRITNGVALYTSNFTPPTSPFDPP